MVGSLLAGSQANITERARTSTLEAIVVINVYMAFAALAIWYVTFSARPFSLFV